MLGFIQVIWAKNLWGCRHSSWITCEYVITVYLCNNGIRFTKVLSFSLVIFTFITILKKTRCILGKFIDIASIKVNEGWIGSYHKLFLARGPVMHKIIMVSYFPCKYRTFKYSFLQRFTKYWWIGTCRIGSYGPVNHCQWFSNIKCKQTEITQVYKVKTALEYYYRIKK